jgi:hypothetical protein
MPRSRTPTPHAPAAGPLRCRAHARRLLAAVGCREIVRFAGAAGAIALVLLAVEAAQPTPAYANPVTDAVKNAIEWLFKAPQIKDATDKTLRFLVEVPNYIERPGSIAAVGQTTTAIAGASLAAIATLAVVHYWAAGVSLSGGGDPVEAVPKTVGAGLFIVAWPWVFSQSVALTNAVTTTVISTSKLGELAQTMFGTSALGALSGGGVGFLIPQLLGLVVVIVMIAVVFTKIALVATLALLFAGVPVAVALYPLPSLSWIAQFALRLFVAILMIFITWALELAVIGALGQDFLTWSGGGTWIEKLTKPLIGLALLILMMSTAKHWLRVAGVLSGGGGMVRSTLAWAGTHLAFNAAAAHIPDALGGRADSLARQAANDQATAEWRQKSEDRFQASEARRVAGETQAADKAASRKEAEEEKSWRQRSADSAAQVHSESEQAWRQRGGPLRPAAERQASAANAEAAGLAEYHQFVAQEDRSNARTPTPASAASASGALAGSNTIGNADSAYSALRPELQARVGEVVHGGATDDEVRSGLRQLRAEASTPMERQALGELGKVDSDTLGTTIPAIPPGTEQPKAAEPPRQAPNEPASRGEPSQQPTTGQPPKSAPPPTPAEPPKQP